MVHLNEGHSAFAALELARQRMVTEGIGADRSDAPDLVAGRVHDAHARAGRPRSLLAELVEEHLGPLREAMGMSADELLALGRVDPSDPHERFCMTVLALKLSRRANAVSSLHGQVSRAMWTPLFPGRSEEQVPIGHITNGIHVRTWLAQQMHQLYDRHLGAGLAERCAEPSTAGMRSTAIDDGEFWETRQTLKTGSSKLARLRAVACAEAARRIGGIHRRRCGTRSASTR